MIPNELRLGDYIKYDAEDGIFKVIVLEETVSFKNSKGLVLEEEYKNIKPIELTDELIQKLGFKNESEWPFISTIHIYRDLVPYRKEINKNIVTLTNFKQANQKWTTHIDDKEGTNLFYYEISYLHELQHIIYAVCGKELEIKREWI